MDERCIYSLDDVILTKYKEWQSQNHYTRTISGDTESGYYLPDSTYRFWLNDEPTEYALHWHPAIEMIIPLENDYTAIVGQETYKLQPGDIFIIPGGELHRLIAPPRGCRLIYLFDFELLSRIKGYSYLISYFSQPTLINADNCAPIYPEAAESISRLCKEYFKENQLKDMIIYSELLHFMITYARYRSLQDSAAVEIPDELRHKDLSGRFRTVTSFIDEHYTEEISLETAADVAGFSKYHFSRLFKQCTGYHFYDYLCYRRIKAAETLLSRPGISITEIALQSGFSSLSTFNRTFRKIKGCTPSEYRSLYHAQFHSP